MQYYLNTKKSLTDFKDPFNEKSIEAVRISSRRDFPGKIIHRGVVEFSSGNTSGEQSFNASSFDAVVTEVNLFISNL